MNKKTRYGDYDVNDLATLKRITASEAEAESPEFASATVLTAYHYHNDEHPERISADSTNAARLVNQAETTQEPIMVFQAIHTPESDAANLEKESPKSFQNLWNKLYVIPGAPVIITSNINPSLSLFNGARGKFIGPLYLRKTYSVEDYINCISTISEVRRLCLKEA